MARGWMKDIQNRRTERRHRCHAHTMANVARGAITPSKTILEERVEYREQAERDTEAFQKTITNK